VWSDPDEPVAIPVACSSKRLISELPDLGYVQKDILEGNGLLSRNLN
jgi:hypothetical protein